MSILEFQSPVIYRSRQREDDIESQCSSHLKLMDSPTRPRSAEPKPHDPAELCPSIPRHLCQRPVGRQSPSLSITLGEEVTKESLGSDGDVFESEDDRIPYKNLTVEEHLQRAKSISKYLEPLTRLGSSTVLLCWGAETNAYVIPVHISNTSDPRAQWETIRYAWFAEKHDWRRCLPWYGVVSVGLTEITIASRATHISRQSGASPLFVGLHHPENVESRIRDLQRKDLHYSSDKFSCSRNTESGYWDHDLGCPTSTEGYLLKKPRTTLFLLASVTLLLSVALAWVVYRDWATAWQVGGCCLTLQVFVCTCVYQATT